MLFILACPVYQLCCFFLFKNNFASCIHSINVSVIIISVKLETIKHYLNKLSFNANCSCRLLGLCTAREKKDWPSLPGEPAQLWTVLWTPERKWQRGGSWPSIMYNTSNPLHETAGALSSSFSNRLLHSVQGAWLQAIHSSCCLSSLICSNFVLFHIHYICYDVQHTYIYMYIYSI